ncbi:hypothetical protein B0H14DRAFT_1475204 [Mycena olivaceomarginata]|nr:hypothetical protein B0H14DRAFT_1475204 [Mycena olivaceomarginata]
MQMLFLPQELVDECLGHLFYIDLKACALVCRSWSRSAQRALFKDVFVFVPGGNASGRFLSNRLEETLRTSPHLIRHIRSLRLHRQGEMMDLEPFQKVCNIPFTHLEDVYIDHDRSALALQSGVALQQLLSLSTLRRVHLKCVFDSTFLSIWDRCSLNVRHVSLTCTNYDFPDSSGRTPPHSSARIVVESLQLRGAEAGFGWLKQGHSPLDLSRLVVLSVEDPLVLRWPRMMPAFQTIQALDFPNSDTLDLSLFPKLLFLRIEFGYEQPAVDVLETITTSSCIQQIVFSQIERRFWGQLDSRVADLSMGHLPKVGLEMGIDTYNVYVPYFPRLHAKNLLFHCDFGWFERHGNLKLK